MRGVPYWNFPAFDKATGDLRAQGWTVFSPAEHDRSLGAIAPEDGSGDFESLNACLEWDFARIAESDAIVVLPGWETSTGVHWEMTVAYALGRLALEYPSLRPVKVPDSIKHPCAPPELRSDHFHEASDLLPQSYVATGDDEIRVVDPETGGEKGSKLAAMDLLPWDAMYDLAKHFGQNAESHGGKYPDRNWEKGYKWSLGIAAMLRHLALWLEGEELDEEGMPHIRAVHWHASVLHAYTLRGVGTDDRRNT
jgi:hypothetical protein